MNPEFSLKNDGCDVTNKNSRHRIESIVIKKDRCSFDAEKKNGDFLFPTRVLTRSGSADPALNYAISAKWPLRQVRPSIPSLTSL